MTVDEYRAALDRAHALALDYLESLQERPVHPGTAPALGLDAALPSSPRDPADVVADLAAAVEPGLAASNGPRYFGFVTGGTLPAAMAADWLTSTWDQNSALWTMSPAAVTAERIAGGWLLDLLGLPSTAGVGFTPGAQMATWTCLAAARHHVLAAAGWDVERRGLFGAPPVTVVVGEHRHNTIDRAARFLGFGRDALRIVPTDDQGRIDVPALEQALATAAAGPLIVCLQAGEVNTGAFDDFRSAIPIAHDRGAWVHIDGAFGLWARASHSLASLADGAHLADSWTVDGHKWLNVPYDAGYAFVAHPEAQAAAMTELAPYLVASEDARLDPMNWSPDASRRARGFVTYAALQSLGRSGVADLVERSVALARRFAAALGELPGMTILNDVVLNQVLVRFDDGVDADRHTAEVIARVQASGVCWMGGTEFRGRAAMRISVSGWATTAHDVDRSVAAIRAAALDG